jgi:hypothetical protein
MSKRARIDAPSTTKVVWSIANAICASILSFLNGKAIVRNSRVSKQWQVAAKMRQAWDIPDRGIIYHYGERDEWARVLEFCAPYVPKVQRVLVNVEPDTWSLEFEQEQSLRKLFTPELKELRYYDAHDEFRIAHKCPLDGVQHCLNLEELTVSFYSLCSQSYLIGSLTNLKSLTVVGGSQQDRHEADPRSQLDRLKPMFANLESLVVYAQTGYTVALVVNAASGNAPKLQSLRIAARVAQTNVTWTDPMKFPALTYFYNDGVAIDPLDGPIFDKLEFLALRRINDKEYLDWWINKTVPLTLRMLWLHNSDFRLSHIEDACGRLTKLEELDLGTCRYNSRDFRGIKGLPPGFHWYCHGKKHKKAVC